MAIKIPNIGELNPFTDGSRSYYAGLEDVTDKKSTALLISDRENFNNRTNVYQGSNIWEGIVISEPKLITTLSIKDQNSFKNIDVTADNKYAMKVHIPELHSQIGNPCDVGDLKHLSGEEKKLEAVARVKDHPWFIGDTSDNIFASANVTFGSIVSISFEKGPEGGALINGVYLGLTEPSSVQSLEDLCNKKISEIYNNTPISSSVGGIPTVVQPENLNDSQFTKPPNIEILPGNIVCNNTLHPIKWDKLKIFSQEPGYRVAADYAGNQYPMRSKDKITMFVCHWDAGYDSLGCIRAFNSARQDGNKYHTQFCIDNDGTIIQVHDCATTTAHAGNVNFISVGVEISNAASSKDLTLEQINEKYVKKGFPPRPIRDAIVRGRPYRHVGFYDIQLKALKALIESVCSFYNIPIKFPVDANGKVITDTIPISKLKNFKGIINHYHESVDKVDCAGEPIKELFDNG
jgi:hypothetical protein